MIDPKNEKLILLSAVTAIPWVKDIPRRNGAELNTATIHRWATDGRKGIRLETYQVGGVRYTSEAAVERFFERLAVPGATTTTETPSQRKRATARARGTLQAAGILR